MTTNIWNLCLRKFRLTISPPTANHHLVQLPVWLLLCPPAHLQVKRHHKQHTCPQERSKWGGGALCLYQGAGPPWLEGWLVSRCSFGFERARETSHRTNSSIKKHLQRSVRDSWSVLSLWEGKEGGLKNIPPCPRQRGDTGRVRKHSGNFHHCSTQPLG